MNVQIQISDPALAKTVRGLLALEGLREAGHEAQVERAHCHGNHAEEHELHPFAGAVPHKALLRYSQCERQATAFHAAHVRECEGVAHRRGEYAFAFHCGLHERRGVRDELACGHRLRKLRHGVLGLLSL